MVEEYEPAEIFGLLRTAHLPALTERRQCALAVRAAGLSHVEIGERLAMDERTARGEVERVERAIAMGCGLPRKDPFVAGAWFVLHAACDHACTARAIAFLTGDAPEQAGA